GTDDRHKRLAHRYLIIEACFKVGPEEIHEEIFVPKCLRHPVVQPTGGLDRTFSTVINENFTAHVPGRSPKTNSIAGVLKSIGRCPLRRKQGRPRRSASATTQARRGTRRIAAGLNRVPIYSTGKSSYQNTFIADARANRRYACPPVPSRRNGGNCFDK